MPLDKKAGGKDRAAEIDKLMKYLQPGRGLGISIMKSLEELPETYTVLATASRKKYALLGEELIKYFLKQGAQGIFITTNKPASTLIESLEKNSVDWSRLFLIDVVSVRSNEQQLSEENVIYVDSPEDLTELDAAINDCIKKALEKNRFLVLDSLTTLLVYNPERTVERFMHSLSGKTRANQFKAIFTLASETKKETLGIISQFCDNVLEF